MNREKFRDFCEMAIESNLEEARIAKTENKGYMPGADYWLGRVNVYRILLRKEEEGDFK